MKNNKNIIEIKDNNFFKYVNIDKYNYYKLNNLYFSIEKYKKDINGNPYYKISIENDRGENINYLYKNKFTRNFLKYGYSIKQSFNIYESLNYIFND